MDYLFTEINAEAPERVQLMRTIKAEHGVYGSISLNEKNLKKFKENFDKKTRRVEIAVDYAHMAHLEAAGWIREVELANDGKELWITVDWTDEAKKKIQDKQYRYLSADFSMKHIDEETGDVVGEILYGAGLTNRPFIRGMNPILSELDNIELSEEQINRICDIIKGKSKTILKDEIDMKLSDILEALAGLSDADKIKLSQALNISPDNGVDSKQLSELQNQVKVLSDENKKLSEDKVTLEKNRQFDVMLSEGKAVEAQRDAFLSGDIEKFAQLSEDVNLEEEGADDTEGDEDGDEPKTSAEASAKLTELAEAKEKEQGIPYRQALSETVRENKKLYELSESGK